MPRPLLKPPQESNKSESQLSFSGSEKTTADSQFNEFLMKKTLRKPRSKEYMEAFKKLDAGGHVHNKNKIDEIINVIKNEFPEIELTGVLLGCVCKCYLGDSYEVHTVDMAGGIIEHYKSGHPLPGGMEKARNLVLHGGYELVEVYIDCMRCISSSGAVSVISG